MEDQPLSLQPENKQKKLTHEQEGGGQERGHEMLGGGGASGSTRPLTFHALLPERKI